MLVAIAGAIALMAPIDAVPCEVLFRPHKATDIEAVLADHHLRMSRQLPQIGWVVAVDEACRTGRASTASRTHHTAERAAERRDAARKLAADARVAVAQPNWVPQPRLPNDWLFSEQWALQNVGQGNWPVGNDVDAVDAWTLATGEGVTVAVIDTGTRTTHEDLRDKIARNTAEREDGRDNEGNGYIDDVIGWDFVDNDNDPDDPVPDFDRPAGATHSHGTEVAGVIAASTNNRFGIAGMAPHALVLPLRALGDGAGVAATAEATIYATDRGVRLQNHSWGTGDVFSQIDADAMAYAAERGAILVLAAGNDHRNLDAAGVDDYPVELDNDAIISVGAMSRGDWLLGFSNYGPLAVDVAAPGGAGMLSTSNVSTPGLSGPYATVEGTSFAAPLVAGVVALLLERDPALGAAEARALLIASSSASRVDLAGSFGGSSVRAGAALRMLLGAPAPPRSRLELPALEARRFLVNVGATVRLSARVFDPDSSPASITHHWHLTPPPGSQATLEHAATAAPSFIADRCGGYEILHTVDDGDAETEIERRWVYAGSLQPLSLVTSELGTGLDRDELSFTVDDSGVYAVHLESIDVDGTSGFVRVWADGAAVLSTQGKGGGMWSAPFVGPASVNLLAFSLFEPRHGAAIDALYLCHHTCTAGRFDCDDDDSNGCESSAQCAGEEGEGEGEGEAGEGEGEGEADEGEGEDNQSDRDERPDRRRVRYEVARSCGAADATPHGLLLLLGCVAGRRRRR